jgi:cobalt-zinc-cadmium resistance protein CzcA
VLPVLYIVFTRKKKIPVQPLQNVNPMLIIIFIVLGSLLLTQNCPAQQASSKVITLQQAIQQALDSNLSIQSAACRIELNRSLKGSSWDIGKTNISMEYGQISSIKKDNNFAVSQTFAFPTLYISQNRLLKANIRQSEAELMITQNDIANEVKTAWWYLSYDYSRLSQLRYQDSLYTGLLNSAIRKAQVGETGILEKIMTETQSLEIKNQIAQILADIDIYRRKLQILVNSSRPIDIADTVLVKLTVSIPADMKAVTANPSLAYYVSQVEQAQLETKVEKAKLLPDFNIGYFNQSIIGHQEINGASQYFSSSDRFTGFQAGISIPLWFRPQSARVKASALNEEVARIDADYYKKELVGEFNALIQEYSKYKSSLDYYEYAALPQAELIISQSAKSYRAGEMAYHEYIQNLFTALQIKNNYLEAIHLYNQSVIAIEYIIGKIN